MKKSVSTADAVKVFRNFYQTRRRPPSYEEIRKCFGYRSKNAAFALVQRLVEKGILRRDNRGKVLLEAVGSLRLLGRIQAGFPSPAEEELTDVLSLDEYLVRHPEQSYLVQVDGDSMKDAGICQGDMVIIERGRSPRNGDIVIAEVDGDWTLKYYEKTAKSVCLIAANPKYPPLSPARELVIGGVVVAVVRKYK